MSKTANIPLSVVDEEYDPLKGVRLPRDKDLPPVIRELVSNAPTKFKVPTFVTCLAPLGCMSTRVRTYYTFDQDPHALLFQVIVCADQSGGKSFARSIEHTIMNPLHVRDQELRRIEQQYRELKQTRAKNSKLPDPPLTDVRTCPASISIAQIVKRADTFLRKYSQPLTMWIWADELAAATDSNKRAFSNLQTISRIAYDLGSEFGVDYLSDNSYSATVDIIYCSLFCATPSSLDEFMTRRQLEGGNVTRTILCDLGNQLGDDAPEFQRITTTQQALIDKVLHLMMDDTYGGDGEIMAEKWIDMSWLDKTVRKWCMQKNLEAVKSGSASLGVFFKRSSVSAFRAACLCKYLYDIEKQVDASNAKSDELIERLCRQIYLYMAEYILNSMLQKWGAAYEELQVKRVQAQRPKLTLFDQLPQQFTRDQLQELCTKLNLGTPVRVFLAKWTARKLINKLDKNVFVKL